MKALLLGGGGAFGAYEAGVATALLKTERYDLVCGVSIGAINAALMAAGNDDALKRFWYEVLPKRSPQLFPHVARLRRLLERVGSIGQGGPWQNTMNVARAASEFPLVRTLGNFQICRRSRRSSTKWSTTTRGVVRCWLAPRILRAVRPPSFAPCSTGIASSRANVRV